MKNITFSADEKLIVTAREKAANEKTTLNKQFREWLNRYVSGANYEEEFKAIMEKLSYAKPGPKFSREEMNER